MASSCPRQRRPVRGSKGAVRAKAGRLLLAGAATLAATSGIGFAAWSSASPTPTPITELFSFPGPTGFAQVSTTGQASSPTTANQGTNFVISVPGGSQVVPTTNSGVAVNYISNTTQYYEIPTGSTYVSATPSGNFSWTGGSGAGGIPASGSAPISIVECTVGGQSGCTAASHSTLSTAGGVYSGFDGPNPTVPYLEVSTGNTKIPAGATLTLPGVSVTLTASGTAGTVLNWSQFEFDTAANITLFGTSITAAVVGWPSAGAQFQYHHDPPAHGDWSRVRTASRAHKHDHRSGGHRARCSDDRDSYPGQCSGHSDLDAARQ